MAGNPASIRAGLACLDALAQPGIYDQMERLAIQLVDGIQAAADANHIPLTINRIVGAFSTHFCSTPVTNYDEAKEADSAMFAAFFRGMLERNIVLAPSKYEAWFLTTAHTEQDIYTTIRAAQETFAEMQN
jgi:glutamate-1-semialdehyde 2,1-aminomutase